MPRLTNMDDLLQAAEAHSRECKSRDSQEELLWRFGDMHSCAFADIHEHVLVTRLCTPNHAEPFY